MDFHINPSFESNLCLFWFNFMLYQNLFKDFYTAILQTIFTLNCFLFVHAIDICQRATLAVS